MTDVPPGLVLFTIGSLRLADNPALQAAIARGGPIIPVFLWTPTEDGRWSIGRASQWWLHGSLAALDADLRARGSRLIIRGGASAADLLGQLVRDTGARYVTWERGLTPAERAREAAFSALTPRRGYRPRHIQQRVCSLIRRSSNEPVRSASILPTGAPSNPW